MRILDFFQSLFKKKEEQPVIEVREEIRDVRAAIDKLKEAMTHFVGKPLRIDDPTGFQRKIFAGQAAVEKAKEHAQKIMRLSIKIIDDMVYVTGYTKDRALEPEEREFLDMCQQMDPTLAEVSKSLKWVGRQDLQWMTTSMTRVASKHQVLLDDVHEVVETQIAVLEDLERNLEGFFALEAKAKELALSNEPPFRGK